MRFELSGQALSNYYYSSGLEWLETNGLGGWASSTVSGANTRRYHGLLVVAVKPPTKRYVLLSKLDETVCLGRLRFELGTNQYPGALHPQGFRRMIKFEWDGFPRFEYQVGEISLRKTVAAVYGENTTLVLYEVLHALEPFVLELAPLVAARDYHYLSHGNDYIERRGKFKDSTFTVTPYARSPGLNITVPSAQFQHQSEWYYNFEYLRDFERGQDFREDLFGYGRFRLTLNPGQKVGIVISDTPTEGKDAWGLFEEQKRRKEALTAQVPPDDFAKTLALAADQFIVKRGAHRSIIAGYPWFTDWGRDTMISLPGLCISTGRLDDAKSTLEAFLPFVSEGMIPNCFPDGEGPPAYNTVDASLWFFVAVKRYLDAGGDAAFIQGKVLGHLLTMLKHHQEGTRYGIKLDTDGLLQAGDSHTQLTWMDAKCGNIAFTPRYGKAVEINALWYSALATASELCTRFERVEEGKALLRQAEKTKKSFLKAFWNEDRGCLFDFIVGDKKDESVRPNQLIALSLPYEILPATKARSILKVTEQSLLTPVGLRTLEPSHPDYRGRYEGDTLCRDRAYHQGTVWPWLIGPYLEGLLRYGGKAAPDKAQKIFDGMKSHVFEAGLGSISEIFDGSEPQRPAGCPFQAWSVSEVLRTYLLMMKAKT